MNVLKKQHEHLAVAPCTLLLLVVLVARLWRGRLLLLRRRRLLVSVSTSRALQPR